MVLRVAWLRQHTRIATCVTAVLLPSFRVHISGLPTVQPSLRTAAPGAGGSTHSAARGVPDAIGVRPCAVCSRQRCICSLPTSWTVVSCDVRRRDALAGMEVKALDAAMPFDFEHKASVTLDRAKRLTVGIVGFGTFGQFLAKRLVQAGHQV